MLTECEYLKGINIPMQMDFFGIRRQKTLSESSDASTDGAVINTGKQPQQLSIGDAR